MDSFSKASTRTTLSFALTGLAFTLLLTACGGGGGSSVSLPAAPVPTLGFGIKQLQFSWSAVSGASSYKLLENADGASGFSVIQDSITTTSANKDISVTDHDWSNARYLVQACNSAGCTDSAELNTSGAVLKAIGFFKASNTGASDLFGGHNGAGFSGTPIIWSAPSIALSGDGQTLAVGAPMEDGPDQGISADQVTVDDGSAVNSGAVYVFRHSASGWAQQAYIKASNAIANAQFGNAVALNQDGNTLAVSGNNLTSTLAYVYRFSASAWVEQTRLIDGSAFAPSLALDDSGDVLLAGDALFDLAAGRVLAYRYDSAMSTWGTPQTLQKSTPAASEHFGLSLGISGDGNTFVTGANGVNASAGAAYVYRYTTSWTQEAPLTASNAEAGDEFGRDVAISQDGTTIAVSALNEDGADMGAQNGATGDTANGATDSGSVYVFRFASAWNQQAYIKASNTGPSDQFGSSLDLSQDGNLLVVGAWAEDSNATGIGGDESNDSNSFAGAAYQYRFDTTTSLWDTNIVYIKGAVANAGGSFAGSIALSDDGNTLAASSEGSDSNASGVTSGDDAVVADTSAGSSGAVYLY